MTRRAYLTPDDEGGGYLCRRLRFRSEIAHIITGALEKASRPEWWEAFGDMSTDDAAALASEALEYYLASGDSCMIGTLAEYITDDPPNGVLPLDGSTYLGADYPELFGILDPAYISGDSFTLPDAAGRTAVFAGAGAGLSARAVGDSGGVEQVQLTIAEMPAHDHAYNENITADLDLESPGAPVPAPQIAVPSVTGSTGGDQPHENMPPFVVWKIGVWYK